jgi:hypothetical protein
VQCVAWQQADVELIQQVDTSALANVTSLNRLAINDWYDAHYLSVCSGMWKNHVPTMGKNHSTAVCWIQNTGYTFSIAKLIGSDDEQQSIFQHYRTVNTKAPFILLVLSIVSMGLAILAFIYGIIVMARASTKGQMVKRDLPLTVLRIALFACIASTILKTISSAKITASAEKSSGMVEVDGKALHAWTHSGFLAIIWVGTALLWIALALVVAAAFRIAATVKDFDARTNGTDRKWYHL